MSFITTHVLDTALGKPAQGIKVHLALQTKNGGWKDLAQGATDPQGRISDWMKKGQTLEPGLYCLTFETESYFKATERTVFYPSVKIHFVITDPQQHYHLPLLLSPFGYTTYRGS